MERGVLEAIRNHGTLIELQVSGRSLFGDHRPTLRSIEDSGLEIGDVIDFECDGQLMQSFSIKPSSECFDCGGTGRFTTEHHGTYPCPECNGLGRIVESSGHDRGGW